MKYDILKVGVCFGAIMASGLASQMASAQNIAWSVAVGITGGVNLLTNGTVLDALIPNSSLTAGMNVDGIPFNAAASLGNGVYGDPVISYAGAGLINYGWPGSFPVNSSTSSSFAALMDAGGTYQDGGAGSGMVTISGLKTGVGYQVQVFNYAPDGDPGLTTLSGSTPVTLSNLPGAAGTGTYGEYATGTFIATGTNETFNWAGAGSGFTVLGPIAVLVITNAPPPPQPIVWGNATGISGDTNLLLSGFYFDALIPNGSLGSAVTVDGVSFNLPASTGGGAFGDGKISYNGSGLNNFSWPNSFPAGSGVSSGFATLMDDGGFFQNGGSGAGTITLAGLTAGHSYSVQIFNYAPDGDAGLTAFSGSPNVVLSNLPGPAGNGQFATGTFTATSGTQSFSWNGSNSAYTVVGAISVRDTTAVVSIVPAEVNQGDAATASVTSGLQSTGVESYQWSTDGGSSGQSWSDLTGATGSNYVINTAGLAPEHYEYRVTITGSSQSITSSPVALIVIPPSAPVVVQDTIPTASTPYVGQGASFFAVSNGNHPITNQWQVSHDGGTTFQAMSGQTNTTLVLTNLQPADSGEYRLAASNEYGSNSSTAALLTVKSWTQAHIQWSAPVSLSGLTAGEILTNVSGSYFEAVTFFPDSSTTVYAGNESFVFRSDGRSASIAGAPLYAGQFITNAIYGSGAWGTNSTTCTNFDLVLDQYYDGGGSNLITLHNLIVGQQYSMQLFALDNRTGTANEQVSFADVADTNDLSASFAMGDDVYLIGVFTATNSDQTVQENFLNSGFGNINAVVVRALSYSPGVAATIARQPRQRTNLSTGTTSLSVVADGVPAPTYQWEAGPAGGPYTNLTTGGRFSGTTGPALSLSQPTANDPVEYVVAVTNPAGGVVSAPVDLAVQVVGQPVPSARPIRITCIGASDVSSPTPYGTPNWPDYITPMLGYEYAITNCGASGTTMIMQGNAPYWNTQQYTDALNTAPDIVIIMLGSNDSKPYNWIYQTNYIPDYETLVSQFQALPSHPRIYLNTLLTVYGPGNYDITDPIVTGELCPIIRQISANQELPLIDVNVATKNMPQNFPDNVHPDIAGAHVVAQTVFNGLLAAGETPPAVDEALNKVATASSVNGTNVAANAVDADYTTLWSSAPSDSQWIYVDLGSIMNINGVYLNWGPDYGAAYVVQVSDDATNWTGVYTNSLGSGGIDRISVAATGRYVRLQGTKSGTGNGYSLLDFSVTSVPPISPALTISNSAAQLYLSWPASAIAFQLESTASLAPPVTWTMLSNALVTNSNGNNYTEITPTAAAYFRLVQK